jgi:hypothetical protein
MVYRPILRSLQPSLSRRSAGTLAALLVPICASGAIGAIAPHYSRQQQASPLVRATDALRCGSPHDATRIQTAS